MSICIDNTVVEFGPSAKKTFNENLYRGGLVFTLRASLLVRLMNATLHTSLLKFNHITPSNKLIWLTITSIKI